MASERYHGIYAIPATPFHDDLTIDGESFRREIDFCGRCGAQGIVWPVGVSEMMTLSDDERRAGFRLIAAENRRRSVFVAGVSGTSIPHAVELAKAAADAGADAVIAVPPYTFRLDTDGIIAYFREIAAAVPLPICVQNQNPPMGTPLAISFVQRLAHEVPSVCMVKEEVPPALQRIGQAVALTDPPLRGVFGGGGGINLIEEIRRGGSGNMPACQWTDILVDIYALARKDEEGARRLHRRFLPAVSMERLYGVRLVKEVLKRRGIVTTTAMRQPAPELDQYDRYELDRITEEISDLPRVKA
ncbi:MAG TPA: dihydrodipicolinate synthase family protein [Chloroflexota bacterium]|nr:dihydrodipicolinate synthase family protein [Chloroflexota bacterium]